MEPFFARHCGIGRGISRIGFGVTGELADHTFHTPIVADCTGDRCFRPSGPLVKLRANHPRIQSAARIAQVPEEFHDFGLLFQFDQRSQVGFHRGPVEVIPLTNSQ